MDDPWRTASALQFEDVLPWSHGVDFAHYWFYKLDFVLWHEQQRDHELWGNFRFTAKNSVEHISLQNPQATDTNKVSKDWLDRFGNLTLVSRSINSEITRPQPMDGANVDSSSLGKGSPAFRRSSPTRSCKVSTIVRPYTSASAGTAP